MVPQTPWFERKFQFHYPVGLLPVIIERLKGTVVRLEIMLKDQPESKLSLKKNGGWCIKEIVGHLYDLEYLWLQRIDDFLQGKEILTAADLTNTRTHEADHASKSLRELLEQFRKMRSQFIERLESLDEAGAAVTALHPRLQQPMRAVDAAFFAAEHDDHELTKIRRLLNEA